eukprot:gene56948-biopygen106866
MSSWKEVEKGDWDCIMMQETQHWSDDCLKWVDGIIAHSNIVTGRAARRSDGKPIDQEGFDALPPERQSKIREIIDLINEELREAHQLRRAVIIAGDFNQPFHNSKYDCKEPDTRTWAINQMFSGIYAYKVPLDSDDGDSKVWTYWRGHAEDQDGKGYTEVDAFFVNEWAVASIDGHARALKPTDKERKDHRPIQLEIDMKVMTKIKDMNKKWMAKMQETVKEAAKSDQRFLSEVIRGEHRFQSKIYALKDEDDRLCTGKQQVHDVLMDSWTKIFTANNTEHTAEFDEKFMKNIQKISQQQIENLGRPFTKEEVEATLADMNANAAAIDVPSDIFVKERRRFAEAIAGFYNRLITDGGAEGMLDAEILLLPKTEDEFDPIKRRPIVIGQVIARCMTKILDNRLRRALPHIKEQGGFKEEVSAEDVAAAYYMLAQQAGRLADCVWKKRVGAAPAKKSDTEAIAKLEERVVMEITICEKGRDGKTRIAEIVMASDGGLLHDKITGGIAALIRHEQGQEEIMS